jgi:phosphate transport system substrate-binding protein
LQRFDKISFGAVQNRAGNFVAPDAASFQAAVVNAKWETAKDFNLVLTDAPGPDAYPITATTFVLMQKHAKSPQRSAAAIDFVRWSFDDGKPQAEMLHYVPLPSALIRQIELYWQQSFEAGILH